MTGIPSWVIFGQTAVPVGGIVQPIDGVQDDWPAVMAAAAVSAASGMALVMVPSSSGAPFQCKSAIATPNGATIVMSPGVIIDQLLTAFGTTQCAFAGAEVGTGTPIAFAANNTPGTSTISLSGNTGVIQGVELLLRTSTNLLGNIYAVQTITGSGPYTVTLDRPVQVQYTASTSTAQLVASRPTDIRIYGNGATIRTGPSGYGGSFINFVSGLRCYVKDLILDGTGGGQAGNFGGAVLDVGSTDCELENVHILNVVNGLTLAGCENCRLKACTITNCNGTFGYQVLDSYNNYLDNCSAYNCGTYGLIFQGSTPTTQGSFSNVVSGGVYNGSAYGAYVTTGSSRNVIRGACLSSVTGFSGDNSGGTPTDNVVDHCDVSNCTHGVYIQTGMKGTRITNLIANNVQTAVLSVDDYVLDGLVSRGAGVSGNGILDHSTGVATVKSSAIEISANSAIGIITRSGKMAVDGLHFTGDGASGQCLATPLGGKISFDNVVTDGSGSYVGIQSSVGSTTRLGHAVDLTGAASGFRINCAGALNQSFVSGAENQAPGPIVANGTSAVAVAFADLRDTDMVVIQYNGTGTFVAGGKIVKTAGTGFTYTGASGSDTGNYDWRIVG